MKTESPTLPEKSKNFFKVPFEMTKRGLAIYLKQNEKVCKFLYIKQGKKDGSLECIFPNLNSVQRGISQTLNIVMHSHNNDQTKIVNEVAYPERFMNDPYISYHTTGRVNYHGFTFIEQYYDPLDKIEKPQFFFMVSLCKIDTLVNVEPSDNDKRDVIVVDISAYSSKRCNFLFSVVPKNFLETLSAPVPNVFAVDFQLYGLAVEILDDATTFNLSDVYDESAVVKLKPHCGIYDEQVSTINEAFLNYQHRLYQTKELIVLPPNGEGTVQVIFVVEMRRPPWIKIEFEDESLVIDENSIKRGQTNLSFKVKNKKTGQTVKNADEIRIKTMFLDANIYEDESIPPKGFI